MGRASRKIIPESAPRDPSASLESIEMAENILRAMGQTDNPRIRDQMVRDTLETLLYEKERPLNERRSGLQKDKRAFRLQSPLLRAVADDPRFQEDLQIMVDLDATLFPMDDALREMGVFLRTRNISSWNQGDDGELVQIVMRDYWNRPDLAEGELSDKEAEERNGLLVEFFARLHSSASRMNRAGVYEYAPQMLELLQMQGVRIHLFTHRSERASSSSKEWVRAMKIPHDELLVVDPSRDPLRSDKIEYCKRNNIPVCIDDKPSTIEKAEKEDIEALSLSWNYAQDAIHRSGADPAECWRELGEGIIYHLENKVRERARREGITLPDQHSEAEV